MNIDIDTAQARLLRELLAHRLTDLSSEIRHTDNREYRDGLKQERDVITALLTTLEPAAA